MVIGLDLTCFVTVSIERQLRGQPTQGTVPWQTSKWRTWPRAAQNVCTPPYGSKYSIDIHAFAVYPITGCVYLWKVSTICFFDFKWYNIRIYYRSWLSECVNQSITKNNKSMRVSHRLGPMRFTQELGLVVDQAPPAVEDIQGRTAVVHVLPLVTSVDAKLFPFTRWLQTISSCPWYFPTWHTLFLYGREEGIGSRLLVLLTR